MLHNGTDVTEILHHCYKTDRERQRAERERELNARREAQMESVERTRNKLALTEGVSENTKHDNGHEFGFSHKINVCED